MDEFNFKNNSDIGSSVAKLKNNRSKQDDTDDLRSLINELSDRIDDMEIRSVDSVQLNKPIKKDKKNVESNKSIKKETKFNYMEIIIYMVIFVLLTNTFIIGIIYNLPFIKNNSPYPNLILRTLLFGLLIYLYKKYLKNVHMV